MNTPQSRFVWLVGAIKEEFADLPDAPTDSSLVLWDRKHAQAVATIAPTYAQAMCLETTRTAGGAPFTALEAWFNATPADVLASEGIPT